MTIRIKVQDGTNAEGKPVYKVVRKSKLFPADASLETERKRSNALKKWKKELKDGQAHAEALALKKKREAEERTRIEAEEAARNALPSAQTVGEYVNGFVDGISKSVTRTTLGGYRTTAAKIAQAFPGVALHDLTHDMVQAWVNSVVDSGLSPKTAIKYFRLLSEACKHAVIRKQLDANPCYGVRMPKDEELPSNSLTAEGYARLAAALDTMEPTPVVTAAIIAMQTGMRQGEVCGLRWRSYDKKAGTLYVTESIGKAPGGTYAKEPKTRQSKRLVPVSPQLAAALERRRALMVAELEESGITLTDAEFGALYIVGYVDGRYHSPSLIGRGWHAMSGAFGLVGTQGRQVTFHDLRHSFASLSIAANADVAAVSAVLGHARISTTVDKYVDTTEEAKRMATQHLMDSITAVGTVEPYAELAEEATN